jgi:hypothetical protein
MSHSRGLRGALQWYVHSSRHWKFVDWIVAIDSCTGISSTPKGNESPHLYTVNRFSEGVQCLHKNHHRFIVFLMYGLWSICEKHAF